MSDQTKNLYLEFQKHSQDFLRLMGEKTRYAESGKAKLIPSDQIADEVALMEFFWDGIERIIADYELKLHGLKLLCVNEKTKALILQNEIKNTYAELYKVRDVIPFTITKILSKTVTQVDVDLNEEVIVKNQVNG